MARTARLHYLSVAEAAEEIGVHKNTLLARLKSDDCGVPLRSYSKRRYFLILPEEIDLLKAQLKGVPMNDHAA